VWGDVKVMQQRTTAADEYEILVGPPPPCGSFHERWVPRGCPAESASGLKVTSVFAAPPQLSERPDQSGFDYWYDYRIKRHHTSGSKDRQSRRVMRRLMAVAALLTLAALTATGQEFEAASVKPASEQDLPPVSLPAAVAAQMGFGGGPGTKDPGRIRYRGVSLKMLLARAYNISPDQVSGPAWMDSERYSIEAVLPPGTDADHLQLMLQKLLTERFGIRLHKDVKETLVYRLKVAKNGPKLLPPEVAPTYENDDERRAAMDSQARAGLENYIAEMKAGSPYTASLGRTGTTAQFADGLSSRVDRPVRDETHLEGKYRFELRWTPDKDLPNHPSGISIYTALEEQLGLKLEAGKEAVEWLVIDKADKMPTGN
jgi:uncharacterized protein (TIGR03435 family)